MKFNGQRTKLRTIWKSVSMGLFCLPVGLLAGACVWATAEGSGYWVFLVAAPMTAFLSGTCVWWLVMASSDHPRVVIGGICGALAAILGHYLCWYTLLLAAFIYHSITGGYRDSLGGPPMNPLQGLLAAGIYGLWSLLFLGWFTVPTGAVLGGLLARFQRSKPHE